ncbi:hypothetical protein ACT17R_17095 [Sphingopyxis sp. Q841]|uniref:hypothetical protein n=1 Tax=Sphingopyxis sp. Q841 TaxID=3458250 RepID=UPI004035D404
MLLGLQTQDDRTAAIVGASLVESALEHLLVAAVQSNARTLKQRLFENRGPLSDFNSKILIAQAFGLIAERVADDMQRIRRIRNCFAHARLPVTFEEPLVAKEVSALAAVMAVRSTEAHYVYEPFPYHSHKTSYGLSCYITTLLLNHRHVEKGGDAFIRM